MSGDEKYVEEIIRITREKVRKNRNESSWYLSIKCKN